MYDENYALLRASRALTVFIILIVLRNKYPVFDSSKKKNVSNLQCLCGIRDVFYC